MAGDVLHRLALTVNSSLDIKVVLERLAQLALEVIPADRCTLFLVDESGVRLVPTLSVGKGSDPALWERLRSMDPINLLEPPGRLEAFHSGRVLAVPDMASSPLIPTQFAHSFGSRSALIVPLLARGDGIGVLSLDWLEHRRFCDDEVFLMETVGTYAALAIRNARLYSGQASKARSLERIVAVAGILNSPGSRRVPDAVCAGFEELLGTNHCSVNLVGDPDPYDLSTVAERGLPLFRGSAVGLRAVSPKELTRLVGLWSTTPTPVVYGDIADQPAIDPGLVAPEVRSVALFPLMEPTGILGAVIAGFPRVGAVEAERLELGQALADLASTAIGRMRLDDALRRRLEQLEVMYRLSDVVAGSTGLVPALRMLNRVVHPQLGIRLQDIALANAAQRQAVGARAPNGREMEAIRSWRAVLAKRRSPLRVRTADGVLLVPVAHRSRVHGCLAVRLDRTQRQPVDHDLLLAIGAGCAEVIVRATLNRDLAESERRLAVAGERERIARDLHDSVGQLLVGLGMRLSHYASDAPDQQWRDRLEELTVMAAQGSREVRQVISALLFLEPGRQGLLASLRDLARKFETAFGISVSVQTPPRWAPLAASREDALFRTAHEALMNVARHARASLVSVALSADDHRATLTIRDDGVGLGQRHPFRQDAGHFGVRAMQQRLEEVGGRLEVANARPRGVVVTATVPGRPVPQERRLARAGAHRDCR